MLTPVLLMKRYWLLPIFVAAFVLKQILLEKLGWRWAYFPFFGEIGYYVAGILCFRVRKYLEFNKIFAYVILPVMMTFLVIFPTAEFEFSIARNFTLCLFVFIVTPSLFRWIASRGDRVAGNLTYGVYIVQFFVFDGLLSLGLKEYLSSRLDADLAPLAFAGFGLLLSALFAHAFEIGVQRYVDRFRRSIFHRKPADRCQLPERGDLAQARG